MLLLISILKFELCFFVFDETSYTVYTRILAEYKTQNKKDEIVGSVYTRMKIKIKINNKNQNCYTYLKGSAYIQSG